MSKFKLKPESHIHSNGLGYITRSGHTMLQQDIVAELQRSEQLEKEVKELNEFKEKVNKELRLWNNEECCFSSSFRGMDNIENLMLEVES